jgi:hypothetical protein
MTDGPSYTSVVDTAKRLGRVSIDQYDQHPRALAYRRAVYRAVKKGLLKRVKSPPQNATYVAVEAPND